MNSVVFVIFLAAMVLGGALLCVTRIMWGPAAQYFKATVATLAACFVGLLVDANLDFGDPTGFLSLRIVLPMLATGLCILKAVTQNRKNE